MSSLDSQQITLTLTKVPYVLSELRKKGRIKQNAKGVEVFQIQFDSRTFDFVVENKKQGVQANLITVGKSVAECLIADGHVIVGAPIDGEVTPVLDVVREFDLSTGEKESPTTCGFCHEDMGTPRALAQHILDTHNDDEEESAPSHSPARGRKAAVKVDENDVPE